MFDRELQDCISKHPAEHPMRKRHALLLPFLLLAGGTFAAVPAAAETGTVTIADQYGLGYLPTIIMRQERLVERQAEAAGVKDLEVRWTRVLGGAAANDALISNNADYVGAGIGPLLTLWDKTQTTLRVKAIGGLDASTLQLLTTNPAVRTLGDLTPADRIAVPAVKVSQQAVLLQMAAEQLWGQGQHERLDALTIALPHSEAVPALLTGVSGVSGHFSNEPFQTKELANPKVHALTSSEQILGGPATVSALYTTGRFRDRNPEVNRFVLNALAEAHALIAADREKALQIVLAGEPGLGSEAELRQLLASPTIRYSFAPLNTHKMADFMYRVGRLKTKPESWRDYFFDDIHGAAGS
jgi:NitT/TauT family transport system substrate-binding protein